MSPFHNHSCYSGSNAKRSSSHKFYSPSRHTKRVLLCETDPVSHDVHLPPLATGTKAGYNKPHEAERIVHKVETLRSHSQMALWRPEPSFPDVRALERLVLSIPDRSDVNYPSQVRSSTLPNLITLYSFQPSTNSDHDRPISIQSQIVQQTRHERRILFADRQQCFSIAPQHTLYERSDVRSNSISNG